MSVRRSSFLASAAGVLVLASGCDRRVVRSEPRIPSIAAPEAPSAPLPGPADAAAPDAAAVADSAPPAPFALPVLEPRWRAAPALGRPSGYLTQEFFTECRSPVAVSGFEGPEVQDLGGMPPRSMWRVTAFRCREPVSEAPKPEPWYSDGSFFLWVARGTLVIEVASHRHQGPRPMQWRAYLERAVAGLPASEPPAPRPPIDRAKSAAFVEAMRSAVVRARRGACIKSMSPELERLEGMMAALVGSNAKPETVRNALVEAAMCHECDASGDGARINKELCDSAAESIDDAEDWLRLTAKSP